MNCFVKVLMAKNSFVLLVNKFIINGAIDMNIFGALFVVARQDHTGGRCLAYVAVSSKPIFMNCAFDSVVAELDLRN